MNCNDFCGLMMYLLEIQSWCDHLISAVDNSVLKWVVPSQLRRLPFSQTMDAIKVLISSISNDTMAWDDAIL